MPIYPLPVLSEEEEEKAIAKLKPPTTIVVQFGAMKQVAELPYDGGQVIGCGTKLVVRTYRGVEIAKMLTTTCTNSGCSSSISRQQMLQYIENSGGKEYPFSTDGKVMRIASVEDLNESSRLESERPRYLQVSRDAVRKLDLPMKIVEVEPLLGRDKIIFYFASEHRIDFRELVRQLARDLHVRVEMRQVGARDEARLVADYEKCGQHCCCKQFLKVLKPISMRSAKVQKATLDPAKISGRCGRLMCCLRYEDETYEELRKRLPHRNTRAKTDDGVGTVVDTQILTQLVLVQLDSNGERQAYPLENIEILTGEAARMPAPPPPREFEQRDRRGPRPEPKRPQPGRPLREEEVESREGERADEIDDSAPVGADELQQEAPSDSGPPLPPRPTQSQPPSQGQAQGPQDPNRQHGRRRRRRRRGRGGPGGPPNRSPGGPPPAGPMPPPPPGGNP